MRRAILDDETAHRYVSPFQHLNLNEILLVTLRQTCFACDATIRLRDTLGEPRKAVEIEGVPCAREPSGTNAEERPVTGAVAELLNAGQLYELCRARSKDDRSGCCHAFGEL